MIDIHNIDVLDHMFLLSCHDADSIKKFFQTSEIDPVIYRMAIRRFVDLYTSFDAVPSLNAFRQRRPYET